MGVGHGAGSVRFRVLKQDQVDPEWIQGCPDQTLFHSAAWLDFLSRTQKAKVVRVALETAEGVVGCFTCLLSKRFGLRIAGSPLRGWTTNYLGFNTRDEAVRDEGLRGIGQFLFRSLGCVHLELMDRQVDVERARSLGMTFHRAPTYEVDLRPAESDILGRMHASVRRYVRRQETRGNLVIEECSDSAFADDYYAQLKEVFAKDGLAPSYGVARVRTLIQCLLPTGNLLLLRARDLKGRCIATGLFPAACGVMHFWGGASYRDSLAEHPNEPLQWYAIRYWRQRGMTSYDMGGGGVYKESYGAVRREFAWIRQSRYRWVGMLRDAAYSGFRLWQRARVWNWARAKQ